MLDITRTILEYIFYAGVIFAALVVFAKTLLREYRAFRRALRDKSRDDG